MNLKYKKIILGVTVSTIVVGLAVVTTLNKDGSKATGAGAVVTQTPEVTENVEITTEPTTDPITSTVVKNEDETINGLVKNYFKASLEADVDTLATLVNEAEVLSKEGLEKKYEYVEDITNIDTYTLEGLDENSKVVFVYYEMKIVDIDTSAPGMIQFYVTKNSDGNYMILLSQIEDSVYAYLKDTLKNPQIGELVTEVNTKLEEAKASDEKLKNFVDKLNESANQAQSNVNDADIPVEEQPETEQPVEEQPATEQPVEEQPATEQPTQE